MSSSTAGGMSSGCARRSLSWPGWARKVTIVASTYRSFAEWLQHASGAPLSEERATMIATLSLGSLLSTRFVSGVLGLDSTDVDDDALVAAWVDMVVATIELPVPAAIPK
jgi:hypothetical protein